MGVVISCLFFGALAAGGLVDPDEDEKKSDATSIEMTGVKNPASHR
jgi:hypothetical protein